MTYNETHGIHDQNQVHESDTTHETNETHEATATKYPQITPYQLNWNSWVLTHSGLDRNSFGTVHNLFRTHAELIQKLIPKLIRNTFRIHWELTQDSVRTHSYVIQNSLITQSAILQRPSAMYSELSQDIFRAHS